MSLGVNLRTGRPKHWPRYPYGTGTDHAMFWVVWNGAHYMLASLSAHLRKKVPEGKFLLLDNLYRETLAPKNEVAFGQRI